MASNGKYDGGDRFRLNNNKKCRLGSGSSKMLGEVTEVRTCHARSLTRKIMTHCKLKEARARPLSSPLSSPAKLYFALYSDKHAAYKEEKDNEHGPDPFSMTEEARARYAVRRKHAVCSYVGCRVLRVSLSERESGEGDC